MTDIYVVYHEDCLDGYGAAWAAYKLFGEEATYVPTIPTTGANMTVFLEENIPDDVTVYAVDIAFPPEALDLLAARTKRVIILDHHQTAIDSYKDYVVPTNVELHMDPTHSGAIIAWTYFHREKKIPEILLYIEDRDLWKWELQDSEAILLALDAYPYTWGTMDRLVNALDRLKTEGQAILKYRNQMIDLQLKAAHEIRLTISEWTGPDEPAKTEYVVPAVNCSIRAVVSEVCHELLNKNPSAPFVVAYRRGSDGRWWYSLRSRKGDFDVAAFAEAYAKGGGHPSAAGMDTDNPPQVVVT